MSLVPWVPDVRMGELWCLEAVQRVSQVFSCCWQWVFHVVCSVLNTDDGCDCLADPFRHSDLVTCGMKVSVDKAGRGVDKKVPVVTISKQSTVMLLWLLEEICLLSPGKLQFPMLTGFFLLRESLTL